MADIAGLPFWQLTFDAQGDVDEASARAVLDGVGARQVTDLIMFSHGWNNSQASANRLYNAWFRTMASQLGQLRTDRRVQLGFVGVFWPSQLWSDEPIPDFQPAATPVADGAAAPAVPDGGGAAGTHGRHAVRSGSTTIDKETLDTLREVFPQAGDVLTRIADVLADKPSNEGLAQLKVLLASFAQATSVAGAEPDSSVAQDSASTPPMLDDDPRDLFGRYAKQLQDSGVTFGDAVADDDGAAGVRDQLNKLWHGAKEAVRQATYWQMKNRAGMIGQKGLGPFIGRLQAGHGDVRVHLIGHSFGARLVSFSLLGLPAAAQTSTVASLTLLQGAFSHFAFSPSLPFAASRKGALAGMLSRIDGPLTVGFSSHDQAVGSFYPLASLTAGEDAAAAEDRLYRWGGMGHDGAQATGAKLDTLQTAGAAAAYRFADHAALNVDCSEVVIKGGAPTGAHSDIVHTELTWLVLAAGKLLG